MKYLPVSNILIIMLYKFVDAYIEVNSGHPKGLKHVLAIVLIYIKIYKRVHIQFINTELNTDDINNKILIFIATLRGRIPIPIYSML